jgi:hypothetical protein
VFEQGKEEEDHGMIQQDCKRLHWYVGSVEGGQGIPDQSGRREQHNQENKQRGKQNHGRWW